MAWIYNTTANIHRVLRGCTSLRCSHIDRVIVTVLGVVQCRTSGFAVCTGEEVDPDRISEFPGLSCARISLLRGVQMDLMRWANRDCRVLSG